MSGISAMSPCPFPLFPLLLTCSPTSSLPPLFFFPFAVFTCSYIVLSPFPCRTSLPLPASQSSRSTHAPCTPLSLTFLLLSFTPIPPSPGLPPYLWPSFFLSWHQLTLLCLCRLSFPTSWVPFVWLLQGQVRGTKGAG